MKRTVDVKGLERRVDGVDGWSGTGGHTPFVPGVHANGSTHGRPAPLREAASGAHSLSTVRARDLLSRYGGVRTPEPAPRSTR